MAVVTNVFILKKLEDMEVTFTPQKLLPFILYFSVFIFSLGGVLFTRIDTFSLGFWLLLGLAFMGAYAGLVCIRDCRKVKILFSEKQILISGQVGKIQHYKLQGVIKEVLVTDSDGVITSEKRVRLDVGDFALEFLNEKITLKCGLKTNLMDFIVQKSSGLISKQ